MTSATSAPESAHSKHSPSSLKYKLMCPGWLSDNSPDRDTRAADRGTRGHAAWEAGNSALVADDPSLRNAVDMCIDFSASLVGEPFKEQRVTILDQFGRFDLLVVDGEVGTLVDAKFAHNLHPADAPQFWAYCVGIWDDPRWEHLRTIHVRAIHPWLNIVSQAKFTRADDYERLKLTVGGLIARARLEDPNTFRPFLGCQYCARAGACPALAKLASEVAVRYSEEPLKLPDGSVHGSQIKDPDVFATLLKLAPIVEAAASGWRRAALALWQEDGIAIPGYDLVEREGSRKITAPRVAYDLFVDKGGKPEDFADIASVGMADMEDLWASLAPKGKKGASKQELTDLLTDRDAITLGQKSVYLKQQKQHKDND